MPLNTSIFSETWYVLEEILKDVPKEQKIMTFCTGGKDNTGDAIIWVDGKYNYPSTPCSFYVYNY